MFSPLPKGIEGGVLRPVGLLVSPAYVGSVCGGISIGAGVIEGVFRCPSGGGDCKSAGVTELLQGGTMTSKHTNRVQ